MYHQPQRNQMPAPPAYYPAMPPQIYCGNDPATFPSPNGHWPLDDGSRGYTYPPVQCHGCCNHNYFTGHFAVRPPYPCHNYAPPAPFYYPSYYPVSQGMYPTVTYFPPLNCNMEPLYEYDKDGHRCSGWCQNRPNGEQGGKVKIVEEDPEAEKKPDSSLVPFEAKKYPYPVAFLQPNETKNAEENKNSDDSRSKVLDKKLGAQPSENQQQQPFLSNGWFPYDMSRSSNQEVEKKNNNQQLEEVTRSHQPASWRGWFPFELSKLGSMKQGGEQKGNQNQIDDDKKMNLPFPIFWMPYQPSVTEGEAKPEMATERNESRKKSSGEGKIDNEEKPERNIPSEGSTASNKSRVVKIIPVKQLKEQVEEDKRTSSEMDEIKKKPLEEGTNKESSSPRKTSKLPPVCLRIEPLQKRKGANGKSRSPSPPGDKRKSHDVSVIQSPNLKKKGGEEDQSDGSEVAKKISKSTGVVDTANGSVRQEGVKLGCESGDNVSHDDTMTNENAKRSNECKEDQAVDCDVAQKASEDREAKIVAAEDESLTTKNTSEEAEKSKKVEFSDAEAATVIQAAYRGFEVRKWEPLKKLKKLAEVKEEAAGIRRRIQALDSSSNVKDYDKEKNMIIEMIMSLLLKLDAVQGLHVSIRDVRKSIAKELVTLQETLDSSVFVDKSSPALLEQPSGISSKEIPSDMKNEDINIEVQNEGNDVVEDHDSSKNDCKVHVEKCEEQQSHETDSLPNFKDFEKSVDMANRESLVDQLNDVSGDTSSEYLHGASDSTVIVGDNDKEHDDVQSPAEDGSRDDEELGEESNFQDVSEEEMVLEIPNNFSLGEHKQAPSTTNTSKDDHMRRQVSGYAVEESGQEHETLEEIQEGEKISEDSKDEEMIISSQEQEAPRETQKEGSPEDEEGEKITEDSKDEEVNIVSQEREAPEETQQEGEKITEDSKVEEMVISSQEQVATEDMQVGSEEGKVEERIINSAFPETVLPLGDIYDVDIPTEFPEEAENSPEPCDAEPDSALEQEECPIEVSSAIHNDEQFEEVEVQKEQLESNTGHVSGGEATLPLHEGISSFINDDVQEELKKDYQGLGTENLSMSRCCNDDKVELVTTRERETGGVEYNHMANSRVEEEIEKNDYGLVSGESEIVHPGVEKSDEIGVDADFLQPDVGADKIENIDHIVIPALKMDVLAGASGQAEELDVTKPSPTGSQASLKIEMVRGSDSENNQKLVEENEKLRDMMEKLLEAGSKQLSTFSELSSRINDLEKRLATKKKKQQRIRRRPNALRHQGITV